MQPLLIIGTTPPPVGGVTVHVSRLLDNLEKVNMRHRYWKLSAFTLIRSLGAGFIYNVIHLHASNPFVRLFVSLAVKITPATLIITYHGNLGRFGLVRNLVDYMSVFLCDIPIVLNSNSLDQARNLNQQARFVSAFMPLRNQHPNRDLGTRIETFSRFYQSTFCTNASSAAFDSDGREIYGISDLIRAFEKLPEACLVFSDPSGTYAQYFQTFGCIPGTNILVLAGEHDFVDVIRCCDVVIRSTTTDGDSLTVKEGLFLEKPVLASDCVDRPEGVSLFSTNDMEDLLRKCKLHIPRGARTPPERVDQESGFSALLMLYSSLT